MVHLVSVPTNKVDTVENLDGINFKHVEEDSVFAAVYGSRYAAQDLPKVEMLDEEMPKETAYRMIK